MLTLYDLSTYGYIKNGFKSMSFNGEDFFKVQLLIKYDITNFGLLEEYVNSDSLEFQEPILISALDCAKSTIVRMTYKKRKTNNIVSFPAYEYARHSKHILEKTDKQVDSSSLVVSSIQTRDSKLLNDLTGIPIYNLKKLLGTLSFNGKNALITYVDGISIQKLYRIIKAVEFYDNQIIRIANNIPNNKLPNNIFTFNALEKERIINARLDEIIAILFKYNNFIWGSLSEYQKERYPKSILSPKTNHDKELKNNFITIIRDYTSLEELQDLKLEPTLRRFTKR